MSHPNFHDHRSPASARRRRFIAASSAIVAVIVGFVTLVTIDRLRTSRSLVRHTLEVMRQAEELAGHLSDVETGQRGFLLTNDERYIEPYTEGRAGVERDTSVLRALTDDNESQRHRLDALSSMIGSKFAELDRTIALQRAGQVDAALALVQTDTGKIAMDSIRRIVSEGQRDDLRRIRHNQRHLLSLVNDILNFARLETGRVDIVMDDVRVDAVLSQAESLVSPQLRARGLHFESLAEQGLAVRADRDKLQQILVNLLNNACKFTPPGGRVTLSADCKDGWARVHVADTGRGIPASKQKEIFEPFVQVDRHLTSGGDQGIGLGLAISRELARAMNGDLTVESEEGCGAKFTVSLKAV